MSDEFTRSFLKHYIARVATQSRITQDDRGFTSISESALDIISDAAIYHLTKIAREIRNLIEHSGRTEPNAMDVFDVLSRYKEDWLSLASFINTSRDQDTDVSIIPYPIKQQSRYYTRFTQEPDVPFRANYIPTMDPSTDALPHIPSFLPRPFGEDGLPERDDEIEDSLQRRGGHKDAIMAAMREMDVEKEPPQIDLPECDLIETIMKAVLGDN